MKGTWIFSFPLMKILPFCFFLRSSRLNILNGNNLIGIILRNASCHSKHLLVEVSVTYHNNSYSHRSAFWVGGSRLPPACHTGLLGRGREGCRHLTSSYASSLFMFPSQPLTSWQAENTVGAFAFWVSTVCFYPAVIKEEAIVYLTILTLQSHITHIQNTWSLCPPRKRRFSIKCELSCVLAPSLTRAMLEWLFQACSGTLASEPSRNGFSITSVLMTMLFLLLLLYYLKILDI